MSEPTSDNMEPPSALTTSPATRTSEKQEEDVQQDQPAGELPITQPMRIVVQDRRPTTGARKRVRRSPSPVEDQRMSLWKDESRVFKGLIDRDDKRAMPHTVTALAAQKSALMVDGQPQFVFFCDGSSAYMSARSDSQDGGYAVVFRDPYDTDREATASASELATAGYQGSREEDGLKVGDFTIRHWLSHRTYGANHVELAAIAQALEEAVRRIDQHRPATSAVKVFTDSTASLKRIEGGISDVKEIARSTNGNRKRMFFHRHTNPFVHLIIWQSHYLSDLGCTVELRWMPRNTTLAHRLADHMAGQWRKEKRGELFNQRYLPHHQRDGILDKLHAEVSAACAKHPELAFGLEETGRKRKRRSETRAARRQRRYGPVDDAHKAQNRSTTDFMLLDSDSDEELLPQPQPKRKKETAKVAINIPKQSTADFIPLEFDSEDEPAHRPQARAPRWYKLKQKGQFLAKKKAPMQQDVHLPALGFLNGEGHEFTFDSGNMPAYPEPDKHEHEEQDAGSSIHGNPGCPSCQAEAVDDLYPWMSGYTGLPSQWALRRY